jgi:bacterioferritin-associated ferredoxin
MYICLCSAVCSVELQDFLNETDLEDAKKIMKKLNIGEGCNTCHDHALKLIEELLKGNQYGSSTEYEDC